MDRKMMDTTSGGAIVNKTPHEARDLISIKYYYYFFDS